jgi:hypothetical protein
VFYMDFAKIDRDVTHVVMAIYTFRRLFYKCFI